MKSCITYITYVIIIKLSDGQMMKLAKAYKNNSPITIRLNTI